MKKENRIIQVEQMIKDSLNSIFINQDDLSFDKFAVSTLEALMLLEREEYLKSSSGVGDSGNGNYPRDFKSLRLNSLKINIPRTRSGSFKPVTLELINTNQEQVSELALLLYRKGLSTRDVSQIMEEYFGESLSRSTISKLAEQFNEIRRGWEKRPLDAYYKVVYCDALFTSLKRGNSYSHEAVYIMYGVKDNNSRELLLLEVNPTEGSTMWQEYFAKLRARGVEQIDLVVGDGIIGLSEAVHRNYPESDIQRCVVHLQRHLLTQIRPRDKAAFSYDLKQVFNNFDIGSTIGFAMSKLKDFVSEWQSNYGNVVNKLLKEEFILEYFTYIDYPVEVRRMIYTNNSIENLNRQIRKVTKTKVTFDKESNLLDLVFMIIKDFELNNWQKYPVIAFQSWPRNTQSI